MNKSKIIKGLWTLFALGWITLILLFVAIWNGWIGYLPPIEQLHNPVNRYASLVLDAHGERLGAYAKSGENRISVDYKDISPNVINALVATEDVRFFEHSGIDLRGLGRAIIKTGILRQSNAGGGSTITQQLAKQLYSERTHNAFERVMQKPIEWVIALKLERFYTKEEILSMYLDQFDFLYNAVGIRQAARTYFGKTPAELNLQESAMLIGMCKNPSLYNPILHRDSDRPIKRRNTVFQQMEKAGYLTDRQVDSLSTLPIRTSYHKVDHKDGPAPYLREYLRRVLMAQRPSRDDYASWQKEQYSIDSAEWEENPLYGWCNKNTKADGSYYNIYTDGLKIYTTISSTMQEYAEQAVREHMGGDLQPAFDREKKNSPNAPFASSLTAKEREEIMSRAMRQSERWRASKEAGLSDQEIKKSFYVKTKMQLWSWNGTKEVTMTPYDSIKYVKGILRTGFMAMNPHNGHVLAYVGGIDFGTFQYDMVTKGRRQTGSILKPFLYSLSMVDGYSPCDEVMHVQRSYLTPARTYWTPRNANRRRVGELVSIQWGLQHSDNWVTAELMSRTTPQMFLNFLRSYGLRGYIEPVMAMSLGTPDASVAEMVSGYTTFVNDGMRISPLLVTQIEDANGNVVASFHPRSHEVLPKDANRKMLYMLQNVVNGGTAGRLRARYGLEMPLGGKTGTTQNNSDGWFIGFTPDIVAGCWVGGEDRSVRFGSMTFGQGAAAALPIFGLFIKKVYADKKLGYRITDKFNLPADFAPCADANDTSSGEVMEVYSGEGEEQSGSADAF